MADGKLAKARKRLRDLVESRKRISAVVNHAAANGLSGIRKRAKQILQAANDAIDAVKKRIKKLQEPPTPEFRVRSRASWGAQPPKATAPLLSTSNGVFIHHTVAGSPTTQEGEEAEMRNLQQIAFSRGFNDISYSFIVFQSGRIYEGRGKGKAGAHTIGFNSTSYAISAAGNYEVNQPSDALVAAARWVRREYLGLGSRPLRGHRDVSQTACPGKNLYARLDEI